MELPTLGGDGEDIEQKAYSLIPWLPDPHRCDCGALCLSDTQYVGNQATYMPVWDCPDCEKRYHRDGDQLR